MSWTGQRRRRAITPGHTARRLTGLELHEVSVVDLPANQGSRHILAKIDAPDSSGDAGGDEVAELRQQIATAQAGQMAAEARQDAAEAAHAESEAALAVLTERLLAAPAAPAPATPAEPAAPAAPARTPREEAEIAISAMAIMAREYPDKAGRAYWRQQIDVLGRHLLPEGSGREQLSAALDDPRGADFVTALQSRPS